MEQLFRLYGNIARLYWYSSEQQVVRSEDKDKKTTVITELLEIIKELESLNVQDLTKYLPELKKHYDDFENYEYEVNINTDDKKNFDDCCFKLMSETSAEIIKQIKLLKDTSNIFEELRNIREQLIFIPKLDDEIQNLLNNFNKEGIKNIDEIIAILKEIQNSSLRILVSSPTERSFEPKIRGIFNTTKIGPVYLAGYFDQDMLPELINFVKIIETRIISPELKNTKQDEINRDALDRLLKEGAFVRTHPMLHARFISTPTELIVGSADIKSDCLGGRRYDVCIWSNNPLIVSDMRIFAGRIWSEAKTLS